MPRRKSNARSGQKKKKLKGGAYLIQIDRKTVENMSPGKLVAAAEYRIVEGY